VRVRDLSPERELIPLIMPRRNESAIYHEALYDITKTRKWLRTFNRTGDHASATLFHLFLWAAGHIMHERLMMNRFVSGGRTYQRKGVFVSFAAKKTFSRDEPLVTVKLPFDAPGEQLVETTQRIAAAIDEARSERERAIDKELRWASVLPRFVVRFALWCMATLDRWNLLPGAVIEQDPLYSSMFVANLGSVGVDRAYHHLYEYGTVSVFAVLGSQKKAQFVDLRGNVEVKDAINVFWTLDERIADGFVSGDGLRLFKELIENPEKFLGRPEDAADLEVRTSSREAA